MNPARLTFNYNQFSRCWNIYVRRSQLPFTDFVLIMRTAANHHGHRNNVNLSENILHRDVGISKLNSDRSEKLCYTTRWLPFIVFALFVRNWFGCNRINKSKWSEELNCDSEMQWKNDLFASYCLGKIDGWLSVRCTRFNRQWLPSVRELLSLWRTVILLPLGMYSHRRSFCKRFISVGCAICNIRTRSNSHRLKTPQDVRRATRKCSWAQRCDKYDMNCIMKNEPFHHKLITKLHTLSKFMHIICLSVAVCAATSFQLYYYYAHTTMRDRLFINIKLKKLLTLSTDAIRLIATNFCIRITIKCLCFSE